MKKKNKQLPGQMSIFDSQKVEEIYNLSKVLGQAIYDELATLQKDLEKMSLEDWNADENKPRRDMKDCLVIAGVHISDVIKQLEAATAIEFQMRIATIVKR